MFPNIILNKVDYTNINIPRHWKLSERHNADIKSIISNHYIKLKPFYDDTDLSPLLNKVQTNMQDLYMLAFNTPFFAEINKKDGTKIHSIFDNRTSTLLFRYYFLKMLTEYIALKDDTSIIVKEVIPKEEESDIISSVVADEEATGTITAIEIVRGEKKVLGQKLAQLLVVFLDILRGTKKSINYNEASIIEKVSRAKDKEKDSITKYLGDLTDEEREIENIFKNQRLERWDKGLQKGLVEYVGKTYDEEREALDNKQNVSAN